MDTRTGNGNCFSARQVEAGARFCTKRCAFFAVAFRRGALALFAAFLFVSPFHSAIADGDAVPVCVTPVTSQSASEQAGSSQTELAVSGWQGAKNYLDSFPITIGGGFSGGEIRFLTNNCKVTPSTGTVNDTFTVTVTGAGAYSMTAVMAGDASHQEISESCSGMAGKADQAPLSVTGWGSTRDYYRTFTIQVTGGTTKGTIRFQADGCNVSPATGNVNSVFTVTVTRVGAYSLTAIMDGNANFSDACSAQYTGMSGKADQASIMIEGFVSNSYYGDSFPVKIAGGSTSEALTIAANGCEVVKDSGNNYTVTVTAIGPYSITASRAGNYGYNTESASACGVAKRAAQSSLSIAGWAENKNVADSFAIHVKGGMEGGTVHFATTGCTIKPASGTTETTFIVTVDTVGTYALTAFIEGDDAHLEATSRELTGKAGKAVQEKLEIKNWNENAPNGGSFDVAVLGGNGTGALSVTTDNGCVAMLKRGEESVYTITVTASNGQPYSLSVSKSGDANYGDTSAQTLSGVAGKSAQLELNVNGWKDSSQKGDEFAIQIAGGSGDGHISFETVDCQVFPESGDIDDVYQVVITAPEGEEYSLAVKRAGDGIYANTSTLRSGSVRKTTPPAMHAEEPEIPESEVPLLGDGFDIWLLIGMLSILLVLVAIAIVLQQQQKQQRRRKYAHR